VLQVTYGLPRIDLLLRPAGPGSRDAEQTEPPKEMDVMHKTLVRKLFVGSLIAWSCSR
jgi:hypothetical protein